MFKERKKVLARIKRLKKNRWLPKSAEKVPEPHRLRPIPNTVLREDDYVKSVEKIIHRDYYPDLLRLRATQRLLDATQENNPQKIKIARQQLECLTPATLAGVPQTPIGDAQSVASSTKSGRIRDSKGTDPSDIVTLVDGRQIKLDISRSRLDSFQSMCTSEDNASFDKIIREEKRIQRQNESWIENTATRHNEAVVCALKDHIPTDDDGVLPLTINGEGAHQIYTAAEPRNALLFYPNDSCTDVAVPQPELKIVANKNTRFPTSLQNSDMLLQKQREKYRLLYQRNEDDKLLAEMVERGRFLENVEPVINSDGVAAPVSVGGFTFEQTPVIVPGMGPDASPLMVWGKVGSTPLLLNKDDSISNAECDSVPLEWMSGANCVGDDDRTPFVVQDEPSKDKAAQYLAERMARNSASSHSHRQRRYKLLASSLGGYLARDSTSQI